MDTDIYDEQEVEKEKGLEWEAAGMCASIAGCKTKHHACFLMDGRCRELCYPDGPVNARNIMRADFYTYNENTIKDYPAGSPIKEMYDNMILKGTSVADLYQGNVFKRNNVPVTQGLKSKYNHKFCNAACVTTLRGGCRAMGVFKNAHDWCLTALAWLDDIENLEGPSSYVLKLVADLIRDSTNSLDSMQGVLVASAASSAMLTSDWWENGNKLFGNEFGFAVQHSLWLAIFAGRIRFTLQPKVPDQPNIGTTMLCDVQEAENFELDSGSVYASICTFLDANEHMRFRPEIHTRNSIGCVEKTTGMAFIRVGDWAKPTATATCIGGELNKHGIAFQDSMKLITVEITTRGVILFPPSIKESLKSMTTTQCTTAKGNGPNENGILGKCGLQTVGGICNWFAVW
uniref:Uncharacterized protein n=2 Tax=Clytia hemisphaerica TaxID=252671 RepID=A0A7M6DMB0_9CNID